MHNAFIDFWEEKKNRVPNSNAIKVTFSYRKKWIIDASVVSCSTVPMPHVCAINKAKSIVLYGTAVTWSAKD